MSLANTIRQWRSNWAQAQELDALGLEERTVLGRDLGISQTALVSLAGHGPDAAAELPRLIGALSLDADRIRQIHAALMRDMSITCSGCTAAVRCRHDLDAGASQAHFTEYCPNGETLQELQVEALKGDPRI